MDKKAFDTHLAKFQDFEDFETLSSKSDFSDFKKNKFEGVKGYFKNYDVATDKQIFSALVKLYRELMKDELEPASLQLIDTKFNGDVDAFIHDAPLLLHHANGEGAGDLRVVGKLFENQIYAIAFRTGSDKQETIKRIQLKLQQRGLMDKLKPRYGI